MKKKKIELNQKLFLNKESVYAMNGAETGYVLGGGGLTGNEKCIRPIDNGTVQQAAISSPVAIGACNVAASMAMAACQPSGMAVCISVQNGNCGTVISAAGNVCNG